jgi:hypothetical protein
VPVNKLAELPAIRHALSTHGTFAKSACGLLKNDSSPRKENPRLRMTRLILAEIFCRCLCLFIRALQQFGNDDAARLPRRAGHDDP